MKTAKKTQKPSPVAMWEFAKNDPKNKGFIVLVKVGDFYECFREDAKACAEVLGLTLTTRGKNSADPLPMAGFPHHALEEHLKTLIKEKKRVCLLEWSE